MREEYIIRVERIGVGPELEIFMKADSDNEARESMTNKVMLLSLENGAIFNTNLYKIEWIDGI